MGQLHDIECWALFVVDTRNVDGFRKICASSVCLLWSRECLFCAPKPGIHFLGRTVGILKKNGEVSRSYRCPQKQVEGRD